MDMSGAMKTMMLNSVRTKLMWRRRGEDVSHAANDTVDSGHGVGTFDGPPSFLGPMSLEALDTDEDRHFDLTGEEQSFAASAFLIEQAVRSTMYELTSGSAREVVRRPAHGRDTILVQQGTSTSPSKLPGGG